MPFEEKENKVIFYEIPHTFTVGNYVAILYGISAVIFLVYAFYKPIEPLFVNMPGWAFVLLILLHTYIAFMPFLAHYSTVQTVIFNYQSRTVVFETKSISEKIVKEYEFSNIYGFEVEKDFDTNNPDGFCLEMELKNGEKVLIDHSFSIDRKPLEDIALTANKHLRK